MHRISDYQLGRLYRGLDQEQRQELYYRGLDDETRRELYLSLDQEQQQELVHRISDDQLGRLYRGLNPEQRLLDADLLLRRFV